ncbi:E3 ubiquitin-protein ligase ORTHRUS 2 [Camellia lanceoleosa]|uniref:E3 ubiquitin-protein ligase ORTHRUS 2 n=1 Tax=Camellia lanceoleosa TaxID=1840588 RepID=A0ACC0I604_9ERIC|nr:E3 ubiquitin-protein ligase ORTHRUS 2 [Camellia lanceoleosa]
MLLPERPVTCFQKWVGLGKNTCANCPNAIPPKIASQPRINTALVIAIRMAKMSKFNVLGTLPKVYHFVHNQNRPDMAYATERAKKAGKANACSAKNDPDRKQSVLVGETWEDRMECRHWGAHLPHVAGITRKSDYGAQSVALSGGYEYDEDHSEWFLYTGSGGRDLSGNKRTNKSQSFDQKFEKLNEALWVSCQKGPIRRNCPLMHEIGVRYDGIEKCWHIAGIRGFKVCRYLLFNVTTLLPHEQGFDDHGDHPRPLPTIKESKNATDITERKGAEEKVCWMWKKPALHDKRQVDSAYSGDGKRRCKIPSIQERLLKEFSCVICRKVRSLPLTTPCAHNFCKGCLESAFAGQTFIKERTCEGDQTLRARKNFMKCPSCSNDIFDFLQNPQVNRELMGVIESLQHQSKETEDNESSEETDCTCEKFDVVSGDAELCNVNSDILEEDEGKKGSRRLNNSHGG